MRTSKNPLAIRSQEWIFASFIKLLLTSSYDDISVSMICADAEIDRRTFYRYFDNKQDVLQSYMALVSGKYLELIARLNLTNGRELLQLFFDFWSGEYKMFLCALEQNKLLHAAFDMDAKYMKEIGELTNLMLGRTSNHYESAFRTGGLINVLARWIAGGFIESSGEMVSIISRVLI